MNAKRKTSKSLFLPRLKWVVGLPIAGLVRVARMFMTARSAREQRTDEKARQAGIRRELRGLPTEHDRAGAALNLSR